MNKKLVLQILFLFIFISLLPHIVYASSSPDIIFLTDAIYDYHTHVPPGEVSNDLIKVMKNNNFMFIDLNGKTIINDALIPLKNFLKEKPLDMDKVSVGDFKEGLALVTYQIDGRMLYEYAYYIDKTGNMVFDIKRILNNDMIKLHIIGDFSDGFSFCVYQLIDGNASLWTIFDKYGNEYIINSNLTESYLFFHEGLASCQLIQNNSLKYGYVNNILVQDGYYTNNSFYIYNEPQYKFNIAIDAQYDFAREFVNGLACVDVNDYCGLINKKGEYIIQPQYDKFCPIEFNDGLACVRKDGKYGYIDVNGNVVIPFIYNTYPGEFHEGYIVTKSEIIDKKGDVLSISDYDDLNIISNGVSLAGKQGNYYLINPKGDVVSDKSWQFDMTYMSFNQAKYGLAVYEKNGKYGILKINNINFDNTSSSNNFIIPIFDEVNQNITIGIKLSWTDVFDNNSYDIYRAVEGSDYIKIASSISSNMYVDINIKSNMSYKYIICLSDEDPFSLHAINFDDPVNVGLVSLYDQINSDGDNSITKKYILMQINNPLMNVNGINIEVDPGRGTSPILYKDRTMLPIRAVVEAMDGIVEWEEDDQKVVLLADGNIVNMWIGNDNYTINDIQYTMDIEPFVENWRTMLPLRFSAQALNCKVTWINDTSEILIVFTA